jgi:predicted AAA+ superfamily ATPase
MISVREINKILNDNWTKVSHITSIEYLDYILESKLIKKVYRYDLKLKNISTWKAKYLFTSSEIRKAILKNTIEKKIFSENIVYETLIKNWKKGIYTWKNWTFNFSFITDNLIIHISHYLDKNEVKKEIRKLLKIPLEYQKILIVDSIKDIWIRPSTYLPLQIMEIEEFVNNFK